MSFADRVKLEEKLDVISRLTAFVDSLPESEREHALLLLTDAKNFSQEFAAKTFRAEGYPCSVSTIKAWRLANVQ